MGYAWDGVCYQDMASAYEAFRIGMFKTGDVQLISLNSSSVNGTGLVSWNVSVKNLSSTAEAVVRTGTTQLITCDPVLMDQWPVQSLMFFIALFFAAFLGFRTGFRP